MLFVADLKGIDYKGNWKKSKGCCVVNTADGLLRVLRYLVKLHKYRIDLLKKEKAGIDTIDKYNKKYKNFGWARVVLVIEEACDVLVEKEDIPKLSEYARKRYDEIVKHLTMLTRKSRCTGIYIFINSQRLSANNTPAQINTNLINAYCGKGDLILSMMLLANDKAAVLIPKDSAGIFIDQNGTFIQSYLADYEKLLKPMAYREEEVKCEDMLDDMNLWRGTEDYSYEYDEDNEDL